MKTFKLYSAFAALFFGVQAIWGREYSTDVLETLAGRIVIALIMAAGATFFWNQWRKAP